MVKDESAERASGLLAAVRRALVILLRRRPLRGEAGAQATLRRIEEHLARQNNFLDGLATGVIKVEQHLRPRSKPWYKQVRTWLLGGLAGLVGSYLFNVPPEWRIDHFFTLRALQRDLAHYESFIPERCEEAVERLSTLRQRVQPSEHEFVLISAHLGQCLQVIAQNADNRYELLGRAQDALEQGLEAFERHETTLLGHVATAMGVRRASEPDLAAEMLLRLAEVQRQLGGQGSTTTALQKARHSVQEAFRRTSNSELQAVALSNLGNLLNHLYVIERRDPDPLLDGDSPPGPWRVEHALRAYQAARHLTAEEPALGRSIGINLGIQYIVLASIYAPTFEGGNYLWSKDLVLDPRVTASLQEARRIFEEIEALERVEGPFSSHSPLTDLLQPNFALALRAETNRLLVTEDGRFHIRELVPHEIRGEKLSPIEAARAQVRRGEFSHRSAQEDASNRRALLEAVDSYRNALELLDHAVAHERAYPDLYLAVWNNLGAALSALGLSHGSEHLWQAVDVLVEARQVPNENWLYFYRDFRWDTGYLRSAVGRKPGATRRVDDVMNDLCLGLAFLRLAAFQDTEEMLKDARVGLGFLLIDSSLDGPYFQIDEAFRLEVEAILWALEEYVGGRIGAGGRPAYYLWRALNVYRDYKVPPEGTWRPLDPSEEYSIPGNAEVTEIIVRR